MYIERKRDSFMRQELEERISILEQSGVISKKVADYSRRAAELVLAEAEDAAQELSLIHI